MKISCNYQELIDELKYELDFGSLNLNSVIKIVREERPDTDYKPIVDWYYEYNEPKEQTEEKTVKYVLTEMIEMNKLF